MARHRVLGISFDHMHMGDLLRQVAEHPDAEIAGICDPDRGADAGGDRGIRHSRGARLHRSRRLPAQPGADLAIVCSATARHAEIVEAIAPARHHVMVEKPFAASAADARRMIAAMEGRGQRSRSTGRSPGIRRTTPPSGWSPRARSASSIEVHFYDGNRGPLYPPRRQGRGRRPRRSSGRSRAPGGTSGRPAAAACSTISATARRSAPGSTAARRRSRSPASSTRRRASRSTSIRSPSARYARGLSKFETRWGTLTDPWTQQPQPKCGFVLVGARRLDLELRLRRLRHAADARGTGTGAGAGRRAAAGPARRGRVHARPHRRRRRRSRGRSTRRWR